MDFINGNSQLKSAKVDGNNEIKGFLTSVEDALDVVRSFERHTNTRFVCWKRPAIFGKKGKITLILDALE